MLRPSTADALYDLPRIAMPNVFPSSGSGDNLIDLHDIVKGYVPLVERNASGSRSQDDNYQAGWLKLVMPERGDVPAYLDPSLDPDIKSKYVYGSSRKMQVVPIEVKEAVVVARSLVRLYDQVIAPRRFREHVAVGPKYPSIYEEKPTAVESAVVFEGKVTLEDGENSIAGVHFRSGALMGWAQIQPLPQR